MILRSIPAIFRDIDRDYLYKCIREFKYYRLIDSREDGNGNILISLSELGKVRVLGFKINELRIKKPLRWDKKWRVVFFDIPEKKRVLRDSLRIKLRELGFVELQKSVWVHPFASFDEIDFVIEFFEASCYVRRGLLTQISNEEKLKLAFKLS